MLSQVVFGIGHQEFVELSRLSLKIDVSHCFDWHMHVLMVQEVFVRFKTQLMQEPGQVSQCGWWHTVLVADA